MRSIFYSNFSPELKMMSKIKREAVPAQRLKFWMTICTICGLSVPKNNRIRHMKTHALDRKTFQCEVCFKMFARRDTLSRHLNIHIEGM
jgi:hypothetical protein